LLSSSLPKSLIGIVAWISLSYLPIEYSSLPIFDSKSSRVAARRTACMHNVKFLVYSLMGSSHFCTLLQLDCQGCWLLSTNLIGLSDCYISLQRLSKFSSVDNGIPIYYNSVSYNDDDKQLLSSCKFINIL
jgi:hypothetical protein